MYMRQSETLDQTEACEQYLESCVLGGRHLTHSLREVVYSLSGGGVRMVLLRELGSQRLFP